MTNQKNKNANRLIRFLLLTLIINTTTACSQTQSKSQIDMEMDKNKSEVLDVTRQLTELMIAKDTVAMNKILDANFTLTHMTGYLQPKEEWFSEIETERMKYYSYKEMKSTVTIKESKATCVFQILIDARIWRSRNNWRLQQTMQLEKRIGKWIILKSVATTF